MTARQKTQPHGPPHTSKPNVVGFHHRDITLSTSKSRLHLGLGPPPPHNTNTKTSKTGPSILIWNRVCHRSRKSAPPALPDSHRQHTASTKPSFKWPWDTCSPCDISKRTSHISAEHKATRNICILVRNNNIKRAPSWHTAAPTCKRMSHTHTWRGNATYLAMHTPRSHNRSTKHTRFQFGRSQSSPHIRQFGHPPASTFRGCKMREHLIAWGQRPPARHVALIE